MLPILAGIVSMLVANNLPKLAQAVTDKGIDYVEDKLGVPLKPDMSPEEVSSIRAEALKHEEFEDQLALDNVVSARSMQVAALQQDDVFSKRFVYYFMTFWSIISCMYLGYASFAHIPEANLRIVDTILGFILGTCLTGMFNYLIGSTASSRQKNELLAKRGQDGNAG
jgi:hypothetical protein